MINDMSKLTIKMAAEDDEIDILGDFSLDDCTNRNEKAIGSTYSDLLKCDYSVHPQWLLDTVSTANWYDNPPQEDTLIKGESGHSKDDHSDDDDSQPSTSSGIVEWTVYEKGLLKKAVEIYGRDYKRISIFVGTKSMQDVKMLIEAEYGINLDNEQQKLVPLNTVGGTTSDYGDILTEQEIPASIEEVICMVSTAEPTIPNVKNNMKTLSVLELDNPRSVLRKNVLNNTNRSLLKKSVLYSDNKKTNASQKNHHVKATTKLKISTSVRSSDDLVEDFNQGSKVSRNVCDKEVKSKRHYTLSADNKKNNNLFKKYRKSNEKSKFNISLMMNKKDAFSQISGKKRKGFGASKKRGVRHKSISESSGPLVEKTVMQIVTGSGQALPLFEGEEVIKIEKHSNSDAECDIEVDIDSDEEVPAKDSNLIKERKSPSIATDSLLENRISSSESIAKDKIKTEFVYNKDDNHPVKTECEMKDIPTDIKTTVLSLEIPQEEYVTIAGEITNLEKFLCPEFFEGRSAKTPERYMAIRTHLIQSWRMCRPHYLTKTAARHGLRNCGDVNCIGKVHTLMEQLGAINHNCEQTSYIRPLSLLLTRSVPTAIPQISQTSKTKLFEETNKISAFRQRKKKLVVDGEGGYTITHTEFGETYEVIGEPKQQKTAKKKQTNLIYCKSFSHDHPAPFSVTISLSALILMDFHSHTSHAEVMGLLGGHYDPHAANVHIRHYVPCDSIEDSGTHCDMCPVSQSEAGEALSNLGVETVGWHHSHPLFPPWPSPQDLLTQQDLQAALSPTPCLAVILSPYWQPGRTSSQYRCLYVKSDSSSGETLAFRFKTLIDCDLMTEYCIENLMQNIVKILEKKERSTGNYFVDMMNDVCPNAQVSYLDKCISSISFHLKSCENQLGITRCKEIITNIRNLVR